MTKDHEASNRQHTKVNIDRRKNLPYNSRSLFNNLSPIVPAELLKKIWPNLFRGVRNFKKDSNARVAEVITRIMTPLIQEDSSLKSLHSDMINILFNPPPKEEDLYDQVAREIAEEERVNKKIKKSPVTESNPRALSSVENSDVEDGEIVVDEY